MTITIDCSCGTSFEVELDPAAGPVTAPVCCPQCGTDAAASLNEALAAAQEPAPVAPVAEIPAPAEPAAADSPALPTQCAQHPDQPVEMFCFVCKKPMCTTCMEQHGFVCSPYCRQKARDQGLVIPAYERERTAVHRRQRRRARLLGSVATVAVVLLVAVWIWWMQAGRKPRLVFTRALGGEDYGAQARFLGHDQVLLETEQELVLYDARDGAKLWSAATPGQAAGRLLQVTDTDLWLSRRDTVLRLDRRTGQSAGSWTVDRPPLLVDASADGVLVVTPGETNTERRATWVALADGMTNTLLLTVLVPPPAPPRRFEDEMAAAEDGMPELVAARTELVAAGPGVLQADIALVATNIVTVQTMKPRVARADGEISVAKSMEVAEEVLNELKAAKTGGIRREDQSRYRVTLRRLLGGPAAPWTGEVTGPPAVFALPSVDLLVAGRELRLFDRANRLRWQATLAYPIAPVPGATEWPGAADAARAPAVERDGVLYFFDQGVLTAFDLASGTPRWRLLSVGIDGLDFDDAGHLYVSSTSAGVESIQYSEQVNLRDAARPVILKVDPATGQVLWKAEDKGERFLLSGKHLFFTRAQVSGLQMLAAASQGRSVPVHFRLYRADPGSGKILWEYYRPEEPVDVAVNGNRILLVFPERLELLRFRSL